jgi:dihydrodipicolinate synthase/N-acetylneuraminate lyase
MKEFVDLCFSNKDLASTLNNKYKTLFKNLFLQSNPLPVKTCLAYK